MSNRYRFFTISKKGRHTRQEQEEIRAAANVVKLALRNMSSAMGSVIVSMVNAPRHIQPPMPSSVPLNERLRIIMGSADSSIAMSGLIENCFLTGNYDPVVAAIPRENAQLRQVLMLGFNNLILFSRGFSDLLKARRIIMAPDNQLKHEQRSIVMELRNIPTHQSAFGFVHKKSSLMCADAHLSYHGSRPSVVVNMDVKNFFQSFSEEKVRIGLVANNVQDARAESIVEKCMEVATLKLFVQAAIEILEKLPMSSTGLINLREVIGWERVISFWADLASRDGLLPAQMEQHKDILKSVTLSMLACGPHIGYGNKFLPQGSPASPVLTNLGFKMADYRLNGLARKYGAFYTRYADDLSFSWAERKTPRVMKLFMYTVKTLLLDEGFVVNAKKSKIMGPGIGQEIVGYTINSGKPTIKQSYRDEVLKEAGSLRVSKMEGNITPSRLINQTSSLRGKAAYIGTCHPRSAGMINSLLDQINDTSTSSRRVLYDSDHDDDIEVTVQLTREEIQLEE